jgi:ferritin-like metal-binding protein YciE
MPPEEHVMADPALEDQLVGYLSDAHSIEEQALVQMRRAPDIAGDPALAAAFRDHLAETEGHERAVRARLEAHGAGPSRVKDLAMRAGGIGMVLFARSQPDTPGKLAAHAHSYEALEEASYELLARVARAAGDDETERVARAIRDEERGMRQRLAGLLDVAAEASLAALQPDDLGEQLVAYLRDAHALEAQSQVLLERAAEGAGDPALAGVYRDHLDETRGQARAVEDLLDARGSAPSRVKDAALAAGGLNWGAFFAAHPDTPGKLAAFAFAVEHLEAAGYEQLGVVARRAGDEQASAAAARIAGQERAAAERIASHFDEAARAALEAAGAAG